MTNLTDDLNIIQALADLPNDTDGLSAAQLKAKFDEAGNTIKTFLNSTHIPEVTTALNGKTAKPAGNGTSGQYLMTNGDGTTQWNTPTGAGDMAKSIYDTNNDGKVNSADSADTAVKVGHTLTLGDSHLPNSKAFDGSVARTLTAHSLTYFGTGESLCPSAADDTPANWTQYGCGFAWFGTNGATVMSGIGANDGYGMLVQYQNGSILVQLFLSYGQQSKNLYARSGSTSQGWRSDFRPIAYTADIPTALSQLTNDSGFITSSGNAATATTAAKVGHTLTFTGYQSATFNGSADKSVAIPKASSTTPTMNGSASVGSETTTWARGDHVHPTDTSRAPIASPTFTGTPKAPKATTGTNTTQIASTSFVQMELSAAKSQISSTIPTKTSQLTNDSGFLTTASTVDNATTASKVGHTLTFSGYQSKTFNGSANVSVTIPSTLGDLSGTLDASKIGSGTFPAERIASSAVTSAKIASSAVTSGKIADSAVTTAKIADGAVTNGKLASGIDAAKITTGTLPIARIADGAVTNAKLASGIDAAKITTGTLPIDRIADGAVTNAKLADGIGGAKITSPAVSTAGARKIYLSTSDPTGGSNGDVWIKY